MKKKFNNWLKEGCSARKLSEQNSKKEIYIKEDLKVLRDDFKYYSGYYFLAVKGLEVN